MNSMLDVKELGFAYEAQKVFRGLSLSVAPSQISAIVGASGAGKTTLLKCLLLLLRPTSGDIRYFLDPVVQISMNEFEEGDLGGGERWEDELGVDLNHLRSRIGYVPQGSVLLPFKTILANVAMPLVLSQSLAAHTSKLIARDALDRMAIGELADAQPWEVSGGQMQRAAIARALAMRPLIYLLDEPTGALDAANVKLVGEQLRNDVRERGASALVVTHNLGFARKYCDNLYVLESGKLSAPLPIAC
jgi:ABC-type polar amino acid transport system ATPase subunit